MFEKFTEDLLKVMTLARQDALDLGHEFISETHIVAACLSGEKLGAFRVLKHLDIDPGRLRAEVSKALPPAKSPSKGQLPFSPGSKALIEGGDRASRALGHEDIGTAHLLLAALDDPDGALGRAALATGVNPLELRARVEETLRSATR